MSGGNKFLKDIDDDVKSFVENLTMVANVYRWGEIEYEGDGMYSIKDSRISKNGKTYKMSYKEIFQSSYDSAMHLLRNLKETGDVDQHFVEWAKEVVSFNFFRAKVLTDESIGGYAIRRAVFGK